MAGRSMSMQRPTLVLSEITIWEKKKSLGKKCTVPRYL